MKEKYTKNKLVMKAEKERKWEKEREESFTHQQHPSADPEAVNPEPGAARSPDLIPVHTSQTRTSAQFIHRF